MHQVLFRIPIDLFGRTPQGIPIYTGLSIGKEFVMGGPMPWPNEHDDYIEGQHLDDKPLGPNEEREYVICSTNDYRPIQAQALQLYGRILGLAGRNQEGATALAAAARAAQAGRDLHLAVQCLYQLAEINAEPGSREAPEAAHG